MKSEKTFTFRHADATLTTVKAPDEATARNLAMTQKWGPEDGKVIPYKYQGKGLDLVP